MSNRINVLVTGVGGCGVGEGIVKALLLCRHDYRLVVCNMHGDAPILFQADAGYVVPPAESRNYLETIIELCRREQVRVVVPGSEPEVRVLAAARAAFMGAGIELVANPPDVVEICNDKWRTHEFLSRNGFGTPASSLVPVAASFWEKAGFPLVVKPRSGHASKNVFVAHTRAELDLLVDYLQIRNLHPMLQEYVGTDKDEFTVSVLVGQQGKVLGSIVMRRGLLGGFSQRVEIEEFASLRRVAEGIAVRLGGFGPVNLQCRWDHETCKVFEINPRFSGTTPFRALAGFNEVDIMIKYILTGVAPDPPKIQYGVIGLRGFTETLVTRDAYDAIPRLNADAVTPTQG